MTTSSAPVRTRHFGAEGPDRRDAVIPLLVFMTVVAFAVRFYGAYVLPPWGDEAFSVYTMKALSSLNFDQGYHTLGFMLLLKLFSMVSTHVVVLRLVAVLFGALSVPVLYGLMGVFTIDARAKLLACALFALSPFSIGCSTEVRFYSFLTFNCLLSSWLFLRALEGSDRRWRWAYLLHLPILLTSHLMAVLMVVVQAAYLVLRDRRPMHGALMLGAGAVALAGAALLFYRLHLLALVMGTFNAPGYQQNFADPASVRMYGLHPSTLVKLPFFYFNFIFGNGVAPDRLALIAVTAALSATAVVFFFLKRRSTPAWGYLVALVLLPVLLVLAIEVLAPPFFPRVVPKYAASAFAALFPVAAIGCLAAPRMVRMPLALGLLLVSAISSYLLLTLDYNYNLFQRYDYRKTYIQMADLPLYPPPGHQTDFYFKSIAELSGRRLRFCRDYSGESEFAYYFESWRPEHASKAGRELSGIRQAGFRVVRVAKSKMQMVYHFSRGGRGSFDPTFCSLAFLDLDLPLRLSSGQVLVNYAEIGAGDKGIRAHLPEGASAIEVVYCYAGAPSAATCLEAVDPATGRTTRSGPLLDWLARPGSVGSWQRRPLISSQSSAQTSLRGSPAFIHVLRFPLPHGARDVSVRLVGPSRAAVLAVAPAVLGEAAP